MQEPSGRIRRFSKRASMAKTESTGCGRRKKWSLKGRQGQTGRVLWAMVRSLNGFLE